MVGLVVGVVLIVARRIYQMNTQRYDITAEQVMRIIPYEYCTEYYLNEFEDYL